MRWDSIGSASEQVLTAQTGERRQGYSVDKRVLDLLVAGILLLALLPVMLLIAVLIVLDTPGSPIFVQERVGLRRKGMGKQAVWQVGTFRFFKFRTMHKDADPTIHRAYVEALIRNDHEGMAALQGEDSEVRKLVNDPRVTRLGAFLRKSSLDELPQLWNVLKGDMSMVGPRPPIPYEVEMYAPWHHRRLEAVPGVTGLWQVIARSSSDFDEMVKLDLYYIEHRSFWLDVKILLMTPLAVWRGDGAV